MFDWRRVLLAPDDSLEHTIKVLHEGGCRIALVSDGQNKLLGTVTDGDIRRALISHVSMDSPVDLIMNKNPVFISNKVDDKEVLSLMTNESFLHMPIVDENKILCGLKTLQDLVDTPKYDNPVFLMAGGFGTRLHPLTVDTPKPLLPVGNRPILETILMQFIEAGFHNFYISIYYKADMIRKHFGDGSNWGVTIKYVHEDRPLGTAGSLGMLPQDIEKLPVLMMNGDLLTKVDFIQLLNFHNEQKSIATMCVRKYDFEVPYGVVTIENVNIQSIVEKPLQKFFVNAGIYILEPELISSVDGLSYIDMPNLLERQIKQGEKINAFPIHEYWLDIGRIEEYEQARKYYSREF